MKTASTSQSGHSRQRFVFEDNNISKMLPYDIILILQDPNFWNQLYELQDLLFLLYGVLIKLQKDVARLYEIIYCFG
ncbi:hypothetical protein F8M41_000290 [Gigaspora margarita]|uniref:Uncharacterized protein n=1 Tax=Gigaspora margarita TaxID=4874 RepID=A0A8H3XHW6_GIGMA|nr:hypothetical protein F8M41_000290 [Gigaspora margarita]